MPRLVDQMTCWTLRGARRNVLPLRERFANGNWVVLKPRGEFNGHDAIPAGGDGSARHDAQRCRGARRAGAGLTGSGFSHDAQAHRCRLIRHGDVRGTHGESIHGGTVKRR
jgi:hypothetical protein